MLPWLAFAAVAGGMVMITVGVLLKRRRGRASTVGTVSPAWIARQNSSLETDV